MNIMIKATAFCAKAVLDNMRIIPVRGCNRNEDCVYFNNTDYLVYEIVTDERFDRDQFIHDLPFFTKKIDVDRAGDIYDFILANHKRVEIKPAEHYAHDDAELIALEVLRESPHCGKGEFKRKAFDVCIEKGLSRAALQEAIINYA